MTGISDPTMNGNLELSTPEKVIAIEPRKPDMRRIKMPVLSSILCMGRSCARANRALKPIWKGPITKAIEFILLSLSAFISSSQSEDGTVDAPDGPTRKTCVIRDGFHEQTGRVVVQE
jgi:hypothetical protein